MCLKIEIKLLRRSLSRFELESAFESAWSVVLIQSRWYLDKTMAFLGDDWRRYRGDAL